MQKKRIISEAKRWLGAIAAILLCVLLFVVVTFVLEDSLGWECTKAHPIATTFSTLVFIVGYILPFEFGVRYHRKPN